MINISKSKFFNFKKIQSNKEYNVYYFKGWNNIIIFRIDFLKKTFNRDFLSITKNEKIIKNNLEKVLFLTKGNLFVKNFKIKKKLATYDAIHTGSSLNKYQIEADKNTQLFIIIGKKESKLIKNSYFNFEKSLKKIDLWGGRCISKAFHAYGISIVLFKLKKNFKFHDNGHKNEQITWLTKGKMNFYIKNKKNLLAANKLSVDIGPYDFHGGKSHGAVGFDVFFPKRKEKRYLQK